MKHSAHLHYPTDGRGARHVWVAGVPVDRVLCADTKRNVAVQHTGTVRRNKLVARVLHGLIDIALLT